MNRPDIPPSRIESPVEGILKAFSISPDQRPDLLRSAVLRAACMITGQPYKISHGSEELPIDALSRLVAGHLDPLTAKYR